MQPTTFFRPRRIPLIVSLILQFVLLVSDVVAVAPEYVSDRRLAEYPVIVMAKWNGKPGRSHALIKENVCEASEGHFEIAIKRVLQGDVKPGTHEIITDGFVAWGKEHPRVMCYMSTQMVGDADADKMNLWFFTQSRSWDKKDLKTYLHLDTYRGVQPRELEPYFAALRAGSFAQAVPKLLASKSDLVVTRTLREVAGGWLPWPYEPMFGFERPEKKSAPLAEQAGAVAELISRSGSPDVRRTAVAVYVDLRGKESVELMRTLLGDEDPDVCGIACGTLALHRDNQSSAAIAAACAGIKSPIVACEVVKRLDHWNDDAAIPGLIAFLQNDTFAYQIGADIGIPALLAQKALWRITARKPLPKQPPRESDPFAPREKQLVEKPAAKVATTYLFPFDVEASQKAWEKARRIADYRERLAHLNRILPNDPEPWGAELARQENAVFVVVTNKSKQRRTLQKRPRAIDINTGSGSYWRGWGDPTEKSDFVTLPPDASHRIKIVGKDSLLDEPDSEGPSSTEVALTGSGSKTIAFEYYNNGNEFGVNAWIGRIVVKVE